MIVGGVSSFAMVRVLAITVKLLLNIAVMQNPNGDVTLPYL